MFQLFENTTHLFWWFSHILSFPKKIADGAVLLRRCFWLLIGANDVER